MIGNKAAVSYIDINTLPFKCLGLLRFFHLKEDSYAYRNWIYVIKNTVKSNNTVKYFDNLE